MRARQHVFTGYLFAYRRSYPLVVLLLVVGPGGLRPCFSGCSFLSSHLGMLVMT